MQAKFYKTLSGRVLPATPTLAKMADKMKLVPCDAPAKPAEAKEEAPVRATRGRQKKAE
ncbi:hypothetical protein KUW19_00830 [Ferrimonas balearica]|uniref:hypothetical protein n=1 Tax=Ferrimonas balearica TaxID=44012 RepID=UPI001C961249|nr:hypothetical protein [Ferrimonas balearica]MBY6105021.1 hypothetical protein [Ferrimonas balearica]